MFESIQVLLDEHTELQEQLADPAVQANQGKGSPRGAALCGTHRYRDRI